MDLSDIEIKFVGLRTLTVRPRSAAYIGVTALLAAFILVFATTPKSRAQTIAPTTASLKGVVAPQLALLPRRP